MDQELKELLGDNLSWVLFHLIMPAGGTFFPIVAIVPYADVSSIMVTSFDPSGVDNTAFIGDVIPNFFAIFIKIFHV